MMSSFVPGQSTVNAAPAVTLVSLPLLTRMDVLLCGLPIALFLSIVSFV